MKLLFDQNLSPKLVNRLADLFPGSSHVQSVGLDCADDDPVWEHARLNGLADALHLAAAIESGCDVFLTNDNQLANFPDITIEVLP